MADQVPFRMMECLLHRKAPFLHWKCGLIGSEGFPKVREPSLMHTVTIRE